MHAHTYLIIVIKIDDLKANCFVVAAVDSVDVVVVAAAAASTAPTPSSAAVLLLSLLSFQNKL